MKTLPTIEELCAYISAAGLKRRCQQRVLALSVFCRYEIAQPNSERQLRRLMRLLSPASVAMTLKYTCMQKI